LKRTVSASVGREQQLESRAVAVALVPAAANGRIDVDEVAVLLVGEERGAEREHVVDESVRERAARLRCAGIEPELDVDGAFGREARRPARVLDHAERGVLAEQRALRPTQDLDALEIREILVRHADVAQEHVVDDDADGGLHVVVAARFADAADRHARAPCVRRRRRQAGRALSEIGDRERAVAIDLRSADDRDRHGHVLRALRAVARRDDQLFDYAG
jgi:hypothetical protein